MKKTAFSRSHATLIKLLESCYVKITLLLLSTPFSTPSFFYILCCRNLILWIYFQVSKDLAHWKLNFFFQIFIHSRVSSGSNGSITVTRPWPLQCLRGRLQCRCLGSGAGDCACVAGVLISCWGSLFRGKGKEAQASLSSSGRRRCALEAYRRGSSSVTFRFHPGAVPGAHHTLLRIWTALIYSSAQDRVLPSHLAPGDPTTAEDPTRPPTRRPAKPRALPCPPPQRNTAGGGVSRAP